MFEAGDGWRHTLWVTNRPATTKGWQGQPAYIDAAHRVHARVEDAIRTGKDRGIGKYPSTSLAMNKAWQAAALTAAALLPGADPERRTSPVKSPCVTALRMQEFDKGRGPVGFPPIGQPCGLPLWPD